MLFDIHLLFFWKDLGMSIEDRVYTHFSCLCAWCVCVCVCMCVCIYVFLFFVAVYTVCARIYEDMYKNIVCNDSAKKDRSEQKLVSNIHQYNVQMGTFPCLF